MNSELMEPPTQNGAPRPLPRALDSRPAPANPVLRIDKLRVEFRSREMGQQTKLAVNDLSLAVQPGEVFGFLGPNGAGKTTTMNVLLGFVNATSGDAYLFGENVREPIARRASATCRR